MAFVSDEIIFYLSGGTSNATPSRSLGGEMSTAVVLDGINNLFGDVAAANAEQGYTDHRCFYVYNNSTESLENVEIFISSQVEGGSDGYLGITTANDEQQISFLSGSEITGGSFKFWIGTRGPATVEYNASMETWRVAFQNAIIALGYSAHVTGSYFPNYSTGYYKNQKAYVFSVTFTENDAKKNQPYIRIVENDLTSASAIAVTVYKIVTGSPVNTTAKAVASGTTNPEGVIFYETSPVNTILIGYLKPREYFPVWLKRVTPPGGEVVQDDGFTLVIRGNATIF